MLAVIIGNFPMSLNFAFANTIFQKVLLAFKNVTIIGVALLKGS